MKKNLLNSNTVETLIARVNRLQADTKPHWGSMTATEMLLHCNKIHQLILSPPSTPTRKTSLKQYIVRWVVLYLMPRFPHNAKAPKEVRTKGTVTDASFAEQKQTFIHILHQFPQHKGPIQHSHPYFGKLNTIQWSLSLYKHLDHHLRQFGV